MKQIDAAALPALVASHDGAAPVVLLDVREPWEVALGRIELAGADAIALPMNTVPQHLDELDRSRIIVCICHHGMRSAQVVSFLERHGFESVYNLAGGTDAWSTQVDARLPRY